MTNLGAAPANAPLDVSVLATNALNNFLKLAGAGADRKVSWGTNSGTMDAHPGRSQCIISPIAHNLGVVPLVVIACALNSIGITEDGGGIGHSCWVRTEGYGASNFTAVVEVNGTSNNGCSIAWIAIG